jgi:magnesium-transporting ATPase (P-type)
MSVIAENSKTGKKYLFAKGAPETIINLCVNASKPTNFG